MNYRTFCQLRESAGVTVTELAKRTGMTATNIKRIEEGSQVPHPATIKRIADALGCDYYRLFELLKEKNK